MQLSSRYVTCSFTWLKSVESAYLIISFIMLGSSMVEVLGFAFQKFWHCISYSIQTCCDLVAKTVIILWLWLLLSVAMVHKHRLGHCWYCCIRCLCSVLLSHWAWSVFSFCCTYDFIRCVLIMKLGCGGNMRRIQVSLPELHKLKLTDCQLIPLR